MSATVEDVTTPLRRRRRADRAGRLGLGLVGFLLVVGAWYLVVATGIFRAGLIPTPHETVAQVVRLFRDADLLTDVRASILRVLVGVALGIGAAIPIGFVLGW